MEVLHQNFVVSEAVLFPRRSSLLHRSAKVGFRVTVMKFGDSTELSSLNIFSDPDMY